MSNKVVADQTYSGMNGGMNEKSESLTFRYSAFLCPWLRDLRSLGCS